MLLLRQITLSDTCTVWNSSGCGIGPSQRHLPDKSQHAQEKGAPTSDDFVVTGMGLLVVFCFMFIWGVHLVLVVRVCTHDYINNM